MSFLSKFKAFRKGFALKPSRPVGLFGVVGMGLGIGGGLIAIGITAIIAPPLIPLAIFAAITFFGVNGMLYLTSGCVGGLDEINKIAKSSPHHEKKLQNDKNEPNNKEKKTTTKLLGKDEDLRVTQKTSFKRPETKYKDSTNPHSFNENKKEKQNTSTTPLLMNVRKRVFGST